MQVAQLQLIKADDDAGFCWQCHNVEQTSPAATEADIKSRTSPLQWSPCS